MTKISAELLDYMGDDLAVVNAARVSMSKESEWSYDMCDCCTDAKDNCELCDCEEGRFLKKDDAGLISFLARESHWTPFSHTAIKLRCSAPVPIRTQCFKHKAGFVENEESRRYISSEPEIFIPEYFRKAAKNVKQGSGGMHERNDLWMKKYKTSACRAVEEYLTSVEDGICPEQARFFLPQGALVSWIWTGNLASFARFYNQRTHHTAQKEIQDLAHMIGDIIKPLFPVSWPALVGGK